MELKDVITGIGILISTILVVIGWLFSQRKEREHEKFKMRLQKREQITQALLDYMQAYFCGVANTAEWHRLTTLVQVYGKDDEKAALARIGTEDDPQTQGRHLNELKTLLVRSVRSDLGYKIN